jgi:subtilisin family serine protease
MIIDAADAATIKHLTSLPEVLEVREPKVVSINPIVKGKKLAGEWGIEKTEADKVHAAGNTGEGIRVSNIDTGVRYTHEALEGNYQNDGFSWYDPYTNSRNPVDENGHGTHTMGTIAGGNGVGMAPGSTWIACRGCDTSSCTEAALTACGEFIACPHGPSSTDNCDVSKKPHVCSNSWGGGQGDNWYDAVIRAWIEVDIVPVFANGNDGQFGCGTASSPADSALNVIAVGSTDDTDSLSYFSSLGPTVSGEIKPDISAPGSDVRSAYNSADNSYESLSGTSMATPHVAGAVALLLSQETTLTFAQIKDRLYQNTEQSLGTGGGPCDGIGDKVFPNHSFGYGRLNILSAINA